MISEKLASLALRLTFTASLILVVTACTERIANFFGYTILPEPRYSPGRMLEFATVFLVAVIALLLRQVREALRTGAR